MPFNRKPYFVEIFIMDNSPGYAIGSNLITIHRYSKYEG